MASVEDILKDLAVCEWASQPDVQIRLLDEISAPAHWASESWHSWTGSVPGEIRDPWSHLSPETKLAIYLMATQATERASDAVDRSEY
jgi:hypothetical protein